MSDAAQAAGTGTPCVTLKYMEDRMSRVDYFNLGDVVLGNRTETNPCSANFGDPIRSPRPLDNTTVCVITMVNGFTIQGFSACASPENFNEAFGRELAYKDAVGKLWSLEAYALRERLHEQEACGTEPRHQFDDPPA